MIPIDLSNRVAVITGGSGALGRVMVRTLAEAGADIAICYYRDQETARLLQDEITANGVRAAVVQADVTDQDSINAMRDVVSEQLGSADIIVNNAVIQYNWTSVLEQPAEDYKSQFQSCVLHNVYMAQAFVPAMVESGWGGSSALIRNVRCKILHSRVPTHRENGAWTVFCACSPKRSVRTVSLSTKLRRDGQSAKRVKRVRPMNITGVKFQCNAVALPKRLPTSYFFSYQTSLVTSRVRISRYAVGM